MRNDEDIMLSEQEYDLPEDPSDDDHDRSKHRRFGASVQGSARGRSRGTIEGRQQRQRLDAGVGPDLEVECVALGAGYEFPV